MFLHPCVGQLRQNLLADVVQGDREDGLLVAQDHRVAVGVGGVAVAVREGDVDIEGLTGLVADDLVFEAVDEAAAAQRQAVAAVGAAREGYAVHGARVVDVDGVAVSRGAVGDLPGGGVLAEHRIDLGLDVLLGRLDVRLFQRDGRIVLRQGDVVQRLDAGPIAVLIQTVAVGEVLVIVIGCAAVDRDGLTAGSGRRRAGLRAARRRQRQRTSAKKAERLRHKSFQLVPSCGPT